MATPAKTSDDAPAMEMVKEIMGRIWSDDYELKIEAARAIRSLTKTSSWHRRQLSGAIEPLVLMLRDENFGEDAILALLNLGVKDERNKIKIVDAGALQPLIGFLGSTNLTLQEYATAVVLTLSASSVNKAAIGACGAIPLLVQIIADGNPQAKFDAILALHNLSTNSGNLNKILARQPIPSLVNYINSCKKSSKTIEKCIALLESLISFQESRTALTSVKGGVLTVVEVLEEGTINSREHAVGALLTMCESDRYKYREIILREGAIPGLLELTVKGTPKSQAKAHMLLGLLRNSPGPRSALQPHTLENIVHSIVSTIDGDDRAGKAKKMLAEMIQISMEQSWRHLQRRASVCPSSELPLNSCSSKLSLK